MHTPWIAGATGLVGRALRAELPDALALVRRPTAALMPMAVVAMGVLAGDPVAA